MERFEGSLDGSPAVQIRKPHEVVDGSLRQGYAGVKAPQQWPAPTNKGRDCIFKESIFLWATQEGQIFQGGRQNWNDLDEGFQLSIRPIGAGVEGDEFQMNEEMEERQRNAPFTDITTRVKPLQPREQYPTRRIA